MESISHYLLPTDNTDNQNYLVIAKNLLPCAQTLARVAALEIKFEQVLIGLNNQPELCVFGVYGIDPATVRSKPMPTWFCPTKPSYITKKSNLFALQDGLGVKNLRDALGVSIHGKTGVIGAIWLFNSLERPSRQMPELLKAYAAQVQHLLEQEIPEQAMRMVSNSRLLAGQLD